ncbi:Lrp/AsnC family transcriptional regulator [Thiorhodococcus mannitoliphagus]|uniref:Lrp/AsnC family transcriptional regulator n=1 Tax=Thiorhodococcus mannitoliphagus TaxID=329406 RepID=A0A6P1DZB6_9GAMM|nr:Lrp/AsnC ligand binding domain-containing protein [Thiorhodococcus mannitoliphagus]NEX23029.1 Lrp/AsnC family transcriptional regulator [Thiorhodococcus mannitoliphagus]
MSEMKIGEGRVVESWRLMNLKALLKAIDDDENEARRRLAEAIAQTTGKTSRVAKDQLGRILSGTGTLGDIWLGYIETAARRLAEANVVDRRFARDSALDFPPESPAVVYVLAAVNVRAWGEILSSLQDMREVVEASLVYGDSEMDAIIKLRAPLSDMYDAILRISAHPHVKHTQSLQSAPCTRMQRKQGEVSADLDRFIATLGSSRRSLPIPDSTMDSLPIPDSVDLDGVSKGLDQDKESIYPDPKIRELYENEIRSKVDGLQDVLSNRHLSIKRDASLKRLPVDIVNAARKRISAVVIWTDQPQGECDRARRYLEAQAKRIQYSGGEFIIERTFVIPDDYDLIKDTRLCYRIEREITSGINVRLLEAARWPKERLADKPYDFGLMDDQMLWEVDQAVNAEGLRIISVSLQQARIQLARMHFGAIWREAQEISPDLGKRLAGVAASVEPPDCETNAIQQTVSP